MAKQEYRVGTLKADAETVALLKAIRETGRSGAWAIREGIKRVAAEVLDQDTLAACAKADKAR